MQLFAFVALSNSALINPLMASRLVYGMARERIIPSALGTVHPLRRTPLVAILFTTLLAIGLIVFGDLRELGGTTALLLLGVFTLVNAAVPLGIGALLWVVNLLFLRGRRFAPEKHAEGRRRGLP